MLRVVLDEPCQLTSWRSITRPISSDILRVEALRTIDRARIRFGLADDVVAERRRLVFEVVETFDLVPVNPSILERAAGPFPTLLGALDSLHLASALVVRAQVPDLLVATHDNELGRAARAVGFEVRGDEQG